jgi:hypothetical protein
MIMVMYIVCKPMDIHGYLDIRWIWIWSDIRTHGYFHGRGNVRLMDLDLDLVLQYPSKPAPLPSLEAHAKLVRISLAGDLEMEPANLVIKRSGHLIRLAQTNERMIRDIGAQTF